MQKGDLVRVKHAALEAWDMSDHGYLWVVTVADEHDVGPSYRCRSLATGKILRWFADELEEQADAEEG